MSFSDPHLLTALGCTMSIFLTAMGSAIATVHGAVYAVNGHDIKAFVPIVVAGVLALYGIIIANILIQRMSDSELSQVEGYKNLAAGLSVGLSTLASGWGMSLFFRQLNDGKCSTAPKTTETIATSDETTPLIPTDGAGAVGIYGKDSFRKIVLANIFLEAIGLYGLIVALLLLYKSK